MKKATKNNKGFSLVELIVVVLIMAVIAVALAPQVTKWIDRSKQATDRSTYESLIAEAQLASIKHTPAGDGTYCIKIDNTHTDVVLKGTGSPDTAQQAEIDLIKGSLTAIDSGWTTAKSKVSGATYYIIFTGGSAVRSIANGEFPAPVDED